VKPETISEMRLWSKTLMYRTKVKLAVEQIHRHMKSKRKFYLSWSGGKDSTAMLHLVRRVYPEIPVLHIASGYGIPDTMELIQQLSEMWKLNLTVLNNPVDYMELCQAFGLPHLRTKTQQKRVVQMIKKDIATQWALESSYTGLFWGLRGEESLGRRQLFKFHPEGILDRHGILRVGPIGNWSVCDIWAYHVEHNIPYSKLYDNENCGFTRFTLRNSGWLSTDGESRGQLVWLRQNYPTLFARVRELL
jgi:phosphoadenosine phosphosulfate reductase